MQSRPLHDGFGRSPPDGAGDVGAQGLHVR
jgi:hypothetical protein